ncbi:hypothetical protein [Streptomyces showdoensis]|uniref:Uncharacterized protein n=1 Tax=Streptomyces showdoensis TaxID=68268 RepID=A0A2P2GFJ2_STREW|nr:hypothetical protein [Streptomyces showdoensis]KKZ70278.1 hypothetical protein VO63_29765 [Streptomyces showdoensis]
MSGHFTDQDERAWQRRAEQQVAVPLDIGSWIQSLRRVVLHRAARAETASPSATATVTVPAAPVARPRSCEPA